MTNINPEDEENKHSRQNYPNPENYEMNQSLFTRQELLEQTGFTIIRNQDYLYFGGTYKEMRHGLGVEITTDTIY